MTERRIIFAVDGIPVPQGSKNPWGGETSANLKPWRAGVATAATEAMRGADPLPGAVYVDMRFTFPRPKAHYGTGKNAGVLKPSAPCLVAKKPDIDKLVRAVHDAMTGIVFRDDSQVVALFAEKRFGSPGVFVIVKERS